MNKLELFNRMIELDVEFDYLSGEFYQIIDQAKDEIAELSTKVINSIVTSIVQNRPTEEVLDSLQDERMQRVFNTDRMVKLTSYSPYNPFVWIRRASRRIGELKSITYQYRKEFSKLLDSVKWIEKRVETLVLKSREAERVDRFLELKDRIYVFQTFKFDFPDLVKPFRLAFLTDLKLNKNNFLSLITVNHDLHHWDGPKNETMKHIKELPEELDFEGVQEAAFVYKLEHDQDCYIFDIFFDEFIQAINQNEELADKTFESFQEIFGPIQTYTAVTDENGDVIEMKPNKPDLKVVSNN